MSHHQPPVPTQPPPVAPLTKPGMSPGKVLLIVAGCIVGFFLLLIVGCTALVAGSMGSVSSTPSATDPAATEEVVEPDPTTEAKNPPAAKPAPKATEPTKAPAPEAEPAEPKMTRSQENAVSSAKNYLEFKGFSRLGLIRQLSSSYGDDFKKSDAVFAVDYLEKTNDVDWNEQAVKSARSYLDFKSFSCNGLVDQLSSSYGDNFTEKQAKYAAKKVGLC